MLSSTGLISIFPQKIFAPNCPGGCFHTKIPFSSSGQISSPHSTYSMKHGSNSRGGNVDKGSEGNSSPITDNSKPQPTPNSQTSKDNNGNNAPSSAGIGSERQQKLITPLGTSTNPPNPIPTPQPVPSPNNLAVICPKYAKVVDGKCQYPHDLRPNANGVCPIFQKPLGININTTEQPQKVK